MTRDRLVTVFVVLASAAVAVVVVWLLWFRPTRMVQQPVVTNPTVVVQQPALTPLRDSGPKNNSPKKKTRRGARRGATQDGSSAVGANRSVQVPTRTGVQRRAQRRSPVKKRQTSSPKHSPAPASQGGSQPPQTASPPPAVSITVPAPVSACVDHLAGLNCP